MKGSSSPSAPQQLHCFWARGSQFRQNKSTPALQLDLLSNNFHTCTYNFQSRFDLLTQMRINAQTHSSREIFHTSILWTMSADENTLKTILSAKRLWQENFVVILTSFIRLTNQVTNVRVVKRTRHKKCIDRLPLCFAVVRIVLHRTQLWSQCLS